MSSGNLREKRCESVPIALNLSTFGAPELENWARANRKAHVLRRRVVALAAMTLALVVTLAGVADAKQGKKRQKATTTTAPATRTWTPLHTWQFDGEKANEASASVTVGFGNWGKLGDMPKLPSRIGPSTLTGCGYDASRDYAIPATLGVKSTTEGFTEDFEVKVHWKLQNEVRLRTHGVVSFASGVNCNAYSGNATETAIGIRFDAVAPGETRIGYFFLVIEDYFSPAAPNGTPESLDEVVFWPNVTPLGVGFDPGSPGFRNLKGEDGIYFYRATGPELWTQVNRARGGTYPTSWVFPASASPNFDANLLDGPEEWQAPG